MKILLIHSKYKERGGEDSVVESELLLLQQYGHEATVFYFDNAKNNMLNLLLLPFNFLSFIKVSRELKKHKPDVVHLHNLHFAASLSVVRAVKRKGIPVVKTLHNFRFLCPSGTLFHNNQLYVSSLTAFFPWQAIKDKVYRNSWLLTFWLAFSMWLHKRLGTIKMIDKYITLNEKSRNIFLSSGLKLQKEQVIVKPNSVKQTEPVFMPVRTNRFLYVGRLSPEKGVEVLLKAFATNNLPLTIIGDGPMRNDVIQWQQQNDLINWLGFQQKEVIDAEMRRCNALIVPSVCMEGMPLTVIEGFANHTPVIASDLGGMASIISNNTDGLLFTPDNADSLNSQLYKWQTFSKAKKSEFSANARAAYEKKYTPEKNLSQLLAIYASVISEPNYKYSAYVVPAYQPQPEKTVSETV